jgi:hypothetical protein
MSYDEVDSIITEPIDNYDTALQHGDDTTNKDLYQQLNNSKSKRICCLCYEPGQHDTYICSNSKCSAEYCEVCLTKWISKNINDINCPTCKGSTEFTLLKSNMTIRQISQDVTKELDAVFDINQVQDPILKTILTVVIITFFIICWPIIFVAILVLSSCIACHYTSELINICFGCLHPIRIKSPNLGA